MRARVCAPRAGGDVVARVAFSGRSGAVTVVTLFGRSRFVLRLARPQWHATQYAHVQHIVSPEPARRARCTPAHAYTRRPRADAPTPPPSDPVQTRSCRR